jgi:hypothetical protein
MVDPTGYLSGGQDLGPTGLSMYAGPDIISRNLTPDKTGMPGGYTLAQLKQIPINFRDARMERYKRRRDERKMGHRG